MIASSPQPSVSLAAVAILAMIGGFMLLAVGSGIREKDPAGATGS